VVRDRSDHREGAGEVIGLNVVLLKGGAIPYSSAGTVRVSRPIGEKLIAVAASPARRRDTPRRELLARAHVYAVITM